MSHSTLSKSDIYLNQETFNWHNRMPKIFEEHEEIVRQSQKEAEDGLKVSCTANVLNIHVPYSWYFWRGKFC